MTLRNTLLIFKRTSKPVLTASFIFCFALTSVAQTSNSQTSKDSTSSQAPVAQDGVYDRPFVGSEMGISVGGYAEANSNYFVTDGATEGLSLEARRFNLFVYSGITQRLKLFAELEFEHGTEEIALETALMDYEITPSFVLRGGIILPPLGRFNTNHDSPKWEFVDRPLVSTQIIGATLHEVGFGAYGKLYPGNVTLSYDLYMTNGLGNGILSNDLGRVSIPDGQNESRFEEDNNGTPAFTGRLAARYGQWGEIGLSFYTGRYNSYKFEGDPIDEPRRLSIFAVDYITEVYGIELKGEAALVDIDIPDNLNDMLSERQIGGHLDIVAPVWEPQVFGSEAIFNLNLRLEAVDYYPGQLEATGDRAGKEVYAIVPGLSFRPSESTVIRANYRRSWNYDLLRNPNRIGTNIAGFQLGFATYF